MQYDKTWQEFRRSGPSGETLADIASSNFKPAATGGRFYRPTVRFLSGGWLATATTTTTAAATATATTTATVTATVTATTIATATATATATDTALPMYRGGDGWTWR